METQISERQALQKTSGAELGRLHSENADDPCIRMRAVRKHFSRNWYRYFLSSMLFVWLPLASCASTRIGGGRPVSNRATAQTPPVAEIETVNQDAVLAAMAKLEAEIAGLKAGRDIKGVEYTSQFGLGAALAVILVYFFDFIEDLVGAFLLHKQKMAGKS